ncbi:ATP-binding protein [Streptomyces sp. SL13]|uniref:histidine kinase n=1 Tax=Streptantibioticus silvisoli TaxID=2705255 RepID=A0AA90GZF6_9ACTN|nr:ATP-binding protein [Streptantibioticus silvisoli]MDI5961488.1 ATP-binding protein [Streptantibioticus silvisoli]MDI5968074.1 ATP-binding protein [Streptantibioticus silvisoli]
MTRDIPEAVFWCLLAVALAVVVLLIRERRITARLRGKVKVLEDDVRARDAEVRHLAAVRLPALMESLTGRPVVPGLLHGRLAGSAFATGLHTVLDLFARSTETARERADVSAKSALKSSMRALQGLANEQQLAISEMQERHDDPYVLADLLEIDHTNSQFGRRAQAISVLCGSWPGRQRAASPLVDVVRGATSRIRDYRRVQVHSQVDVAVTSRAVEPIVLAVAELLDNAARHSQPNTSVQVNLQHAHNGVAIVIDDAGVGLLEQEIHRAEQLLAGQQSVDIQKLGDPPQFGFAVIGILADRYGFRVSVDTQSPYGGVRAVVFLPTALLTRVQDDTPRSVPAARPVPAPPAPIRPPLTRRTAPAAAPAPEPAQASAPAPEPAAAQPPAPAPQPAAQPGTQPDPASGPAAEPMTATALGLPKRRRRQPLAENVNPAPEPAEPAAPQGRSASEAAAIMGAFARGTRSGRSCASDATDSTDSTDSTDLEGNSQA